MIERRADEGGAGAGVVESGGVAVTTTAEGVWGAAVEELRLRMAAQTFDGLLRGSEPVDLHEGTLVVQVRDARALAWLDARWAHQVEAAVRRQAPEIERVLYVVRSAAGLAVGGDEDGEEGETILEAVREQRTTVTGRGPALTHTDFYIKLKTAFRKRALAELKGAPLSVFLCLALHVDRDGVAYPGIETIMRETDYSRGVVCNALGSLVDLGLCSKRAAYRGNDEYIVNGYAWFGQEPAPCLWEETTTN